MNKGPIGPKAQIDIASLETLYCENCKAKVFAEGMLIKRVSALLTGTGKEGLIPIPAFYCVTCGTVVERYLPDELKDSNIAKPQLVI